MKKLIALFVSAILMMSIIPSKALAVNYEKDKDREPGYISLSGDDSYQLKYFYDDDYFRGSSYDYNASLSTMSIVMALASTSFAGPESDYVGGAELIETLMGDIGMKNIEHNEWYDKKPDADSIAVACGSRQIDNFTLVTIAVRGGGYGNEWSSNFTMGPEGNHEGFEKAALDALEFASDYIARNDIKGNIKVWTMGFSRAAATANIIGAKLDQYYSLGDDVVLEPDGVYAYCFETPCGASKESVDNEYYIEDTVRKSVYDNIFNITNPNDLVTYVAPTTEGYDFRRYGVDLYLPSAESSPDYFELRQRMLNVYFSMPGGNYYSLDTFSMKTLSLDFGSLENTDSSTMEDTQYFNDARSAISQREFFKNFIDDFGGNYIGGRDNYMEGFQTELRTLFSLVLGSEPDEAKAFTESLQKNLGDQFGKIILNYLYEQSGFSDIIGSDKLSSDPVGDIMVQAAKDAGITAYDEATLRKTGNMFLNLILHELLNNPNSLASLMGNVDKVAEAHDSILCYSWLASMDSNYFYAVFPHMNNGDYRVLKISGSGNVTVRNSKDKLVAQFASGEPVFLSNSGYRYGNDGAQMVVYLPLSEDYNVSFDHPGDKDISVVIGEYSAFACKYTRIVNYQGDIKTLNCPAVDEYYITNSIQEGSVVDYKYTGNGSIKANDYNKEYVDRGWRDVKVSSSSIVSGFAYGGGRYMIGETINLTATANRGSAFGGWLEKGSVFSSDSDVLYRVNKDAEIVADYKIDLRKCAHTTSTVRGYKNATCEEDGYTGDTYCPACGELLAKGKVIPAKEHFYVDSFCSKCQRVDLVTYEVATEFKLFEDEDAAYVAYLESLVWDDIAIGGGGGNSLLPEDETGEIVPEVDLPMIGELGEDDKSNNWIYYVAGGAGILAIGGGVTAFILMKKKKKQNK